MNVYVGFYRGFDGCSSPARVFLKEQDAIEWNKSKIFEKDYIELEVEEEVITEQPLLYRECDSYIVRSLTGVDTIGCLPVLALPKHLIGKMVKVTIQELEDSK